MLTRKQHQLLLFLHRHLSEEGVSPSFDEMKDALSLKSKSGIHRLISGLEERGFIRRLPHRARAIEILRLPDEVAGQHDHGPSAATGEARRFTPSVVAGTRASAAPLRAQGKPTQGGAAIPGGESAISALPLYGRIAAGTPIEALRDESNYLQVPRSLLSRGDHYALEVEGDSMIEAGIHDGDTIIIQRCEDAENGEIVVALVDGEEVTLKRLRKRKGAIALEPANPTFETRLFPPDRVQVQGRLVGLIRRY